MNLEEFIIENRKGKYPSRRLCSGDIEFLLYEAVNEIDRLQTELIELRSKLPQGRDAEPLFVGMNCFVVDGADGKTIRGDVGIYKIEIVVPDEFIIYLRSGDGDEWTVNNYDCYSTEQAAREAAEKGKE